MSVAKMAKNPVHKRFPAGPKRPKATHSAEGAPLTNKEKNALSVLEHPEEYGAHAQGRIFSIERIRVDLASLSRDPFRDILTMFLGAQPSEASILSLSKDDPSKWVNAVSVLARLSGYTDKLEVTQNIYARIATMSDSELEDALTKLNSTIIDVSPIQTQAQDLQTQTQGHDVQAKQTQEPTK